MGSATCGLAFGTPFYCDYAVSAAPDEVTSLSAFGGDVHHGPAAFNTTHWSVVLEAQGESPAAAIQNYVRGQAELPGVNRAVFDAVVQTTASIVRFLAPLGMTIRTRISHPCA